MNNVMKTMLMLLMIALSTSVFAQNTSRPGLDLKGEAKKAVKEQADKVMAKMMKDMNFDPIAYASGLKDLGLSKKNINLLKGNNMEMFKKVGDMVRKGVSFKDGFKQIKSLNKGNLKNLKTMLPKDQFKAVKPMQKDLLGKVKNFMISKL